MKNALCKLLTVGLLLSQFGCTSQLWEDTDPRENVWINAKDITEAELKSRGVEYEVYTSETCNGYLVEKSAKDKFKDYNLRLLGAPVTLVVDAAGTVVVGAAYVLLTNPELTCEIINFIDVCN